ncbi:MAG: 2-C-methyl-D-erythritol 4-phosphate cytidylyltransferase [Gemmatimonadetes bacterium]|nr:2-C-methyl-D-erythritol 4-phosphate cytidylyltransferase [Gemmatimonadota bacterium]
MSGADVGVVIVAAGSSSRTGDGELKQFKWIAGRPMLLHSLQLFQERADVAMVVCVVPPAYAGDPPPWIFQSDSERLLLSVGGRTRAESVRNGIADLPATCRIILVHDAARPLVPMAVLDRVVDAVRAGHSAIAALPVVDTLKEVDADGRIVRTVPREGLWRAQTPQGFPRDVLLRAHRAAMDGGYDATDDAALVEQIGEPVVVVRGSERAMKVTEAADFGRAEAIHGLSD